MSTSTAAPKKTATSSLSRVTSASDPSSPGSAPTTPARYPNRSSTPVGGSPSVAGASSAAASSGNLTRSRSVRTGTPVSARAAAAASHQRRESGIILGSAAAAAAAGAGGASGAPTTGGGPEGTGEEARAEAVAALEDVKARLSKAESAAETLRRQLELSQGQLDESVREQARLEEQAHEREEQAEALRNERRDAARQIREMEAIYEAERAGMMKEKDDMMTREEEMQAVINRLKDSLAVQRSNALGGDDEARPSRQSNNSPNVDGGGGGGFAPPSSLHRSDSRNNSKLLLAKDKLIESLRLELAEAQIKLVESENQGGGRLHEVERLLMEARMANARLMEDNESYQLLLQEKTLNGDFGKSDFSYMGNTGGGSSARNRLSSSPGRSPGRTAAGGRTGGSTAAAANQDALNALEGRSSGTSLADELSGMDTGDHDATTPGALTGTTTASGDDAARARQLEAELRSQKDQNKALTLYINKIIERLLQHQDFEHILDQSSDFRPKTAGGGVPNTDKELPPPPPGKAGAVAAAGSSLLQRAKSIAVSATAAASKPRPRPMSFMPGASLPQYNQANAFPGGGGSAPPNAAAHAMQHQHQQPGGYTDPETAPSIPIGLTRTSSLARRPGRPMSEQFLGSGGGGSVVNQMYRPGPEGLSPTGVGRSQTFNFLAGGAAGGGPRQPSGSSPLGQGQGNNNSNSNSNGAATTTTAQTPPGQQQPTGGNFPGMRSETSSTSESEGVVGSPGQSPPRAPPRERDGSVVSGSSSGEKANPTATTFAGNKPRPLRLVQENNPGATAAMDAQNKRASWIGWAWGAGGQPGSGGKADGMGEAIRE